MSGATAPRLARGRARPENATRPVPKLGHRGSVHRSRISVLALAGLAACAPEPAPTGMLVPMSMSGEPLLLTFPVAERERIETRWVMGMDHDPEEYEGIEDAICTAYDGSGYPSCYDEHEGTDFDLAGGFEAMDAGSATVIAAAAGIVEEVVDQHYDRCHLDEDSLEVTCDGHPIKANRITLRHPGGEATQYKHLAQDSALVEEGELVEQGQPLALIGSSGWSTAPHLHLELWPGDGRIVDPFAGEFSQATSYWCEQDGPEGLPGDCD